MFPIHTFFLKISSSIIVMLLLSFAGQSQTRTDRRTERAERKAERREEVNRIVRAEEEGTIVYSKEWTLGGRLYSDGLGFFYQNGKMKSITKTQWWTVELGSRKHVKEQRLSTNADMGSGLIFGTPLIFGKQNNFLFTKVGMGGQTLLGGKSNRNGVAVSAVYGGGLSLGLIKPYVVNVRDPLNGEMKTTFYRGDNSRTDSLILDPSAIIGAAGFFKGFSDMKITPGVFAKGAIRFDYGRYNELVSAIQCGINMEFYSKTIPIMALNDPKRFFINVFIGVEFGQRR